MPSSTLGDLKSSATPCYTHPRGELCRQLIACLRHTLSTRRPRSRGTDRRGQIPEMLSIHVHPPEVDECVMPGHWEGDLIKGVGNQSSMGVLVERTSRLVLLARMQDATDASAWRASPPSSIRSLRLCDTA